MSHLTTLVTSWISSLEKKFNAHKDFYATKVAELKEALDAKVKYAENLKGEAVEQYAEGFDKALKQVKFLYTHLNASSCGYFKDIRHKQLIDKPLPGVNAVEPEGEDQTKSPEHITDPAGWGEDVVDDSLIAP